MANTAVAASAVKYGSKKRSSAFNTFWVYFFLVLGAFIMIIPLVWMVESSVKSKDQFLTTQLSLLFPKNPHWENYTRRIWTMSPPLQRGILNSLIISFSTIIVGSMVSALAAFSYAKLNFPGKSKLFLAELATMMIPFSIIIL